jgi:hypothetical protein
MKQSDQEFEQRVKTTLESSLMELDADTRRRLAAGRAKALEPKPSLLGWFTAGNWMPVTATAAVMVLAVSLFIVQQRPDAPTQVAQADDVAIELLFSEDDSNDADSDAELYIMMDALMNEEDAQHAS